MTIQRLLTALFVVTLSINQAAIAAPAPGITERVIGGAAAADNAYPWMVAILSKYDGRAIHEHICGGSLIAPQYVLTAAHCVLDYFGGPGNPDDYEVLVGQNKLSATNGTRVAIRGIVIHPDFNPYFLQNDFALIKLDSIVPLTPIEVASPFSPELYNVGTSAKVLGWGQMNPTLQVLPDDLQEAVLPIVAQSECLAKNGRYFDPTVMMCAGQLPAGGDTTRPDSCYGDSGGPLVVSSNGRYKQVGTISWGFECSSKSTYGVYGKVAAGYDFITSRPTIVPRANFDGALPEIIGSAMVGNTISVTAGSWRGDVPTGYHYQWYITVSNDNSTFVEIDGATSSSLLLTESMTDRNVGVVVTAYNDAGIASEQESSDVVYVEPAPVVIQTPLDTAAPTLVSAGEKCVKRNCSEFVSVDDGTTSSGIKSVTAVLKAIIPAVKNKKGKVITPRRVVTDRVSAISNGGNTYKFRIRRAPKVRYQLTATAQDNVGLNSSSVTIAVSIYR